jgi:hypothetical protein
VAGDSVKFQVTVSDPDGGSPIVTTSTLPTNATFVYGALVSNFKFKPDLTQAGTYDILFTAADAQGLKDTHTVVINIAAAANQAAKVTSVLPDTVNVATQVASVLQIKAVDPEKQHVTITAIPILPNAVFVDSGDGVATYTVTPTTTDLGSSQRITFIASDPLGATDTVQTTIRVVSFLRGDLNQDGKYSLVDLANLVNYLVRQGPTPVSLKVADVNGDGVTDLTDLAFLVAFLYSGGPRPPQ